MIKKIDDDTELLIDLLVGTLEEEGYEVLRLKDSKKCFTTAYDGLEVKRHDGIYFRVTVDRKETHRDFYGKVYRDSDTFNDLKAEKESEGK